jgi:hypothetical protein
MGDDFMPNPIPRHLGLVPLRDDEEARADRRCGTRFGASLLAAQLLAVRLDAPAARRLRRADPRDAVMCYGAADRMTAAAPVATAWSA